FAALRPYRVLLVVVGLLLLSPVLFNRESNPCIYTIGFSVFAIGSAALLAGVFLSDFSNRPIVPPFAKLGAYSYSIYRWHLPVIAWFMPALARLWGEKLPYGAHAAIYLSSSLAIGVLMAKLVEMPSLRLRDRWFPPKAAAVEAKDST